MINLESLEIRQGAHLPHWTCDEAIYHVVFRLDDSLPKSVVDSWRRERENIIATANQMGRALSEDEERRLAYLFSEKVERFLDESHGECLLKKPPVAEIVAKTLQFFEGERYTLHAWCVMPTHVHIVVEPAHDHQLQKIVHSWKSFTSHRINEMLERKGKLWRHEAYDHIIRSEKEYRFQLSYVLYNPAKAGLKNWPWIWPKIAT
jgi:REP element-mobilizing transposase RayT